MQLNMQGELLKELPAIYVVEVWVVQIEDFHHLLAGVPTWYSILDFKRTTQDHISKTPAETYRKTETLLEMGSRHISRKNFKIRAFFVAHKIASNGLKLAYFEVNFINKQRVYLKF